MISYSSDGLIIKGQRNTIRVCLVPGKNTDLSPYVSRRSNIEGMEEEDFISFPFSVLEEPSQRYEDSTV
jgi:hypothetical protein